MYETCVISVNLLNLINLLLNLSNNLNEILITVRYYLNINGYNILSPLTDHRKHSRQVQTRNS
jgi:hypothetical protein